MSTNVPVPRLKRTGWVFLLHVGHPLSYFLFLLWWRIGRVCFQNAKFWLSLDSHGVHSSSDDPIHPCCVTIDIHRCKTVVAQKWCAGGIFSKSYVCTADISMLCCLRGRGRSAAVDATVDGAYCCVKTLSVHWMVRSWWSLWCPV